jgi:hypothetical protein
MTVGPVSIIDTFSRSLSGTWGFTDNSGSSNNRHNWLGDTESYWDVDETEGVAQIDVFSDFPDYDVAYIDLQTEGITYTDNQEVLALVKSYNPTTPSMSTAVDHGPVLMYTNEDNFFMASIQEKANKLAIKWCQNGVMTLVKEHTGTNISPDTWYWVRFRHERTTFKLKVWAKGHAEPNTWQITATPLITLIPENLFTGDVGYGARRTSQNYTVKISTFYMDNEIDETSNAVYDGFGTVVTGGWGKTDSGHLWEGHVASDPALYTRSEQGFVTTTGGTYGRISTGIADDTVMYVNKVRTGDVSLYVEFETNTGVTSPQIYFGIHGEISDTGGNITYKGYAARLIRNDTNFTIMKKTAFGGSWATITPASSTAFGAAFTSNTVYKMRIAIIGGALYARLWTGAEPATWNLQTVVDTGTTFSSGVPFIVVNQTDAVVRTWTFHDMYFDSYIPSGTTHTVTGAITVPSPTSTTLPFEVSYTNDSNLNNSIVVEYRLAGTTAWTTFGGTKTRGTLKWTGTITGLVSGSSYEIRATFSDANAVTGTNPIKGTFSTNTTAVIRDELSYESLASTSVTIKQKYLNDSDNDSTASLEYRTTTTETTVFEDLFSESSGTLLVDPTNIPEISGGPWLAHSHTNNQGNATIHRNQLYFASEGGILSYRTYVVQPANSFTGNDYSVNATVYVPAFRGRVWLLARVQTGSLSFYAFQLDVVNSQLVLVCLNSGSTVDSVTYNYTVPLNEAIDMRLEVIGTSIKGYLNGANVLSLTSATLASGPAGITFYSSNNSSDPDGTPYNQIAVDRYSVTTRTVGGSWTVGGPMTADRGNKWFTRSQGGLTAGGMYEFRTAVTDADGVEGLPSSIVVQLKGNEVNFYEVVVTPSETTAVVNAFYTDDANNNSAITIQYKSILDKHWLTLPSTSIRVDRTAKVFTATLSSLVPGLSYEVVVRITDIDGVNTETGHTRLDTNFATKTYKIEAEKRRKHHLVKVYNNQGDYITTWEDAPEIEYSFYENGGVSDLRLKLPRKMSDTLHPSSGINFQNRVDVWELDPSSDGFGINLVDNPLLDPAVGGWEAETADEPYVTFGTDYGPGDGTGVKIEDTVASTQHTIRSNYIELYRSSQIEENDREEGHATAIPLVIMCMGRAKNTKLILDVEAYDANNNLISGSDELGETVGNDWQVLRIEFLPPRNATKLRVTLRNGGKGTVYAGNVSVRAKELLIYRGYIETFSPSVDENEESVEVEILGLASFLSDDYIDFLQYIEASAQPQGDVDEGRPHEEPADPAQMLRDLIDLARKQNPLFPLYYTATSIQDTGQPMRYTFRNKQLRACFDQVRTLCPSGWHYYIDVDGCVYLRDGAVTPTHKLRIGVEVLKFTVDRSIRNLKNYIVVKGRQDSDRSENASFGSINEVAFDQASINQYGRRVLHINDAQLTNPADAELVAQGRLEEHNHEEQKVSCVVMDEKALTGTHTLRGYNIESLRPGDNVIFYDPIAGPQQTYWNQFEWDVGRWDYGESYEPLTDSVPIKRIQYSGDHVTLELSERQPSSIGDFGRMYRVLQLRSSESGE